MSSGFRVGVSVCMATTFINVKLVSGLLFRTLVPYFKTHNPISPVTVTKVMKCLTPIWYASCEKRT